MAGEPLSVNEVLRYVNHDLLNQLHLIKMNLDMGRIDESKEIISQITAKYQNELALNSLGLPKTTEWLQTLAWRYPGFQVTLQSDITERAEDMVDEAIVCCLEKVTALIHETLDPLEEQYLQIQIYSNNKSFAVTLQVNGSWTANLSEVEIRCDHLHIQRLQHSNTEYYLELQANREEL